MSKSKKPTFKGSFEDAQKMIKRLGERGIWRKHTEIHYQFTSANKACFNWYPTTGAILINGDKAAADRLTDKFTYNVIEKNRRVFSTAAKKHEPQI